MTAATERDWVITPSSSQKYDKTVSMHSDIWLVATAAGLGVATFVSMYNISDLLDDKVCPG